MEIRVCRFTAAAAVVAGLCLPVDAQAYETFKIAETGQPTPDGGSTFTGFSPPVFRDLTIVFRGVTTGGWQGLYGGTSSVTTIAAPFASAPGGGLFTGYGERPDVDGGAVVFQAGGIRDFFTFEPFEGIYVASGGSFTKIVDTDSAVPGGTGNFLSFGETPLLRSISILFSATSAAGEGLYGATPSTVISFADSSTPMPEHTSETFAAFHGMDATEESFVFVGESATGFRGVYRYSGGSLSRVADMNTPRPGGGGAPFGTIGTTVSLHGDHVVFTSGEGVYAQYDGHIVRIMDQTMNPPGHTEPFTALGAGLEIDGYKSVFSATGGSRSGLYLGNGGNLWTIRDNSTQIDSKDVRAFAISNESLDSELLAYQALFTDGSQALYGTRYVRVPVGSWLRPAQQQVRAGGSWGFQILHYNFTLGTTFVSPYAEAPAAVEIPLSRNQWVGAYFYDFVEGRFTQGMYRLAQSPL